MRGVRLGSIHRSDSASQLRLVRITSAKAPMRKITKKRGICHEMVISFFAQ